MLSFICKRSNARAQWYASFNEIRAQFIYVASLPFIVIGIVLGGLTVIRPVVPNHPFTLALALLLLGIISTSLSLRFVMAARHLIVWASTAILISTMILLPGDWLPFLVIPLLFVHAVLVTGGSLISSIVVGVTAGLLTSSGDRTYPLIPFITCLALGMLTSWSVIELLSIALRLSWDTERQTDHLLVESRERQGNLAALYKSLDLSATLLEQTNKRLEIARRQSEEAQRLKEQFAANISHELRTPLNLILGFSEMLYMSPQVYGDLTWTPILRRDIYQIYKSSRHLLEMIDDILDLSRFELAGFTLTKEPTNIEALLTSAVEMTTGLFRDRPVSLLLEVEPDLPELIIDRTRIRQVILNLLSNARRFTDIGTVTLRAIRNGGDVLFSVQDTGPGIAADKLKHLFEEFYQADQSIRRQYHGVGLGLAISRHFVQAHEGRIWVESVEGQGSTFYFSLPIPSVGMPTLYPHENRPVQHDLHSPQLRVAVLDADPTVGTLVSRHLKDCDVVQYESVTAMLSDEAINAIPPDMVIQNISPTTHAMREPIESVVHIDELPDTPVIRCSLPSKAWLAAELSVAGSLSKPVTADQLISAIERIGGVTDILVIDDDRGFCQLIERMLSVAGHQYKVRRAYDGEEGLRAMREKQPDLVLLDLIMPRMDGFELLAQKATISSLMAVPVILLSVTSAVEDALIRKGNHLTIVREGGLKLTEVLYLLEAFTHMLSRHDHPHLNEVELVKNS